MSRARALPTFSGLMNFELIHFRRLKFISACYDFSSKKLSIIGILKLENSFFSAKIRFILSLQENKCFLL